MTGARPLRFEDPESAVEVIRKLLEARDWQQLARYYDLTGSQIPAEVLTSGGFFHDPEAEVGHPLARGWLEPFPPSFRYRSHEVDDDLATVEVGLEVDEGGGMVNSAMDSFQLRRDGPGWRLVVPELSDAELVRRLRGETARLVYDLVIACLENLGHAPGGGLPVQRLPLGRAHGRPLPATFELTSSRRLGTGGTLHDARLLLEPPAGPDGQRSAGRERVVARLETGADDRLRVDPQGRVVASIRGVVDLETGEEEIDLSLLPAEFWREAWRDRLAEA